MDKHATFAALHRPGNPVILFNAWDAGSAQAVARGGAVAIATGSWSVGAAHGYGDAEGVPLDAALANAERIVRAVALPVTIDFEGGYAAAPERVRDNFARLAATGAIGANFEDQVIGGEGLYPLAEQQARIAAARAGTGAGFFINARTDIFLKIPPEAHDSGRVSEALDRAHAYAEAGASGMFVPGLLKLDLLERLCAKTPLPVNVMAVPGGPNRAALAGVGVARISHGPFPYRAVIKQLEEAARAALG
ncbi:MAG: phosphonomutase [Proteobacteria bacterium SG_bin6]|nr:MAG: phosphonomutase [Proteobacteria bacterium SG_bin6]